jgi:hypothetical protein
MRNTHRRLAFLTSLLAALLAGCGAHRGDVFSIAVLPDTQNAIDYTHQEAEGFPFDASALFLAQMDWIAGRAVSHGGDVAFVASVGDVWQHQSREMDPDHAARGFERIPNRWFDSELEATPQTAAIELPMARAGYAKLDAAGIPFGVAPGNHDYDAMWSDSRYPPVSDPREIDMTPKTLGMLHIGGLDNFRSVFGAESSFFSDRPWYVSSHAGGTSSAQTFTAGGYTFLHLALEMALGDAALAWASGVISARPGLPTIVTTHDYLDASGERRANPIVDLAAVDSEDRGAEALWNELIRRHDQIFLVLCGHHHGVATRVDTNDAGYEVVQLLADYQDRGQTSLDAGVERVRGQPVGIGDGWLRLLRFDTRSEVPAVRVRTYSPHYRAWAEELATYATWYKAHEDPALDDDAFVAKDSFDLSLHDFRKRFGDPQ